MNPTIKKGVEEVWEEAYDKSEKANLTKITVGCTRKLLVKDGNDPWGRPIEEVVDIVVDDIEGMPWSRDARWEVVMSFDGYFKELRKQARVKFFKSYKPASNTF